MTLGKNSPAPLSATRLTPFDSLRLAARELFSGQSILTSSVPEGDVLILAGAGNFNVERDGFYVGDKLERVMRNLTDLDLSQVIGLMQSPRLLPASRFQGSVVGFQATMFLANAATLAGQFWDARASKLGRRPRRSSPQQRQWLSALRKLRPRLVVGIGLPRELCQAATLLRIPTLEVQHGIIGDWVKEAWWGPAPGLAEMPDLVLTYDRFYAEVIRDLGPGALAIGYPQTMRLSEPVRETPRVLVTLSWDVADPADPGRMVDRRIEQAVKSAIAALGTVEFDFRLHPVVQNATAATATRRWLSHSFRGVTVSQPSQTLISEAFTDVDIHLTSSSSTAIEAALCGVPTYCLDSILIPDLPPELVREGFVATGAPDDFGEQLQAAEQRPRRVWNPIVEGSFEDALEMVGFDTGLESTP